MGVFDALRILLLFAGGGALLFLFIILLLGLGQLFREALGGSGRGNPGR